MENEELLDRVIKNQELQLKIQQEAIELQKGR